MKNIIVANTDKEIEDAIINYDKKVKKLSNKNNSNNKEFNNKLEEQSFDKEN